MKHFLYLQGKVTESALQITQKIIQYLLYIGPEVMNLFFKMVVNMATILETAADEIFASPCFDGVFLHTMQHLLNVSSEHMNLFSKFPLAQPL